MEQPVGQLWLPAAAAHGVLLAARSPDTLHQSSFSPPHTLTTPFGPC